MKYLLFKINNHFNRKNSLLTFLILLIAVLIPTFSGKTINNFWTNLNDILTNSISQIMLIIACIININLYVKNDKKKYNEIIRYSSYNEYITLYIKEVVYITIFLYLVFILLSIAGAIALSFGNYNILFYDYYGISLANYIPIFIIRELLIIVLLNIIIYMLIENNSIIAKLIILLIIGLFTIKINYKGIISHFYDMYLLFSYYLTNISYTNFLLEIICSMIQISILLSIAIEFKKYITNKKKDIL